MQPKHWLDRPSAEYGIRRTRWWKQYQRLFEMENIELTFADEALGAVTRHDRRAGCARSSRESCSRPCSIFLNSNESNKS